MNSKFSQNRAGNSISRAEIDSLREKVTDLISKSPEKAVMVLTGWLEESEKSRKSAPRAAPEAPKIKKVG